MHKAAIVHAPAALLRPQQVLYCVLLLRYHISLPNEAAAVAAILPAHNLRNASHTARPLLAKSVGPRGSGPAMPYQRTLDNPC